MSNLTISIIPMKSKPLFENGFSFVLAIDFDQTLSFNDFCYVLWDLLMLCEMSIFKRLRKMV